jgi:IS605 OrfB family transposase
MNRIYQGRVAKVELLKEKTNKGEDPLLHECFKEEGEQLLWDFHELFQDAVNYYLVCLMALASDPENPITKIRERVDGDDPEHNVWKPFRRKGQKRQGFREVAKYFGLDSQNASLSQCCEKALEGNNSNPELLNLSLLELLEESAKGDVRNAGKEMFPRFCSPKYVASYPADKRTKKLAQENIAEWLHNRQMSGMDILEQLQFEHFANIDASQDPKKGDKAKTILTDAVEFLSAQGVLSVAIESRLREKVNALGEELEFPSYTGGSINKVPLKLRFYTYLLLKHVDQAEDLLLVLKNAYPEPKKKTAKNNSEIDYLRFGDDPIKLARMNDGGRRFVFRAFTSTEAFGSSADNEPVWRDFDMDAFVEALKAFHQIEQKDTERKKEQDELRNILGYMKTGKGTLKKQQADEAFDLPPVLMSDPRIARLEKVRESLAQVSDLAEEELSEYGLSERTIRGFESLVDKWNKAKVENLSEIDARAKLKKKLNELQDENKTTMGSVALFEKLMEPENWIVWQQSGDWMPEEYADKGFARNPLDAYVQKVTLEEDIKRLDAPIRFTPADARYSRRQYQFGDKNTFSSLKGQYHHEQNQLAVVVGMAVRENGIWKKRRVRLSYSAPRFLRDGLRADSENLSRMPWVQPMMEALGERMVFPQDLHNYPVFLMPKRGRNDKIVVNLNFPITLDEQHIAGALGKRDRWNRQFAGGKESNIYLRWPTDEWPAGWQEKAWYNSFEPFTLVSVDLGVRDAGALALIECRPDQEFKTSKGTKRHCRFIGEANGRKWYAAVIRTKMLRLPGEDAMVWRDGQLQQEFAGEKGRLAKIAETNQTREILTVLGYPELFDEKWLEKSFFADQNQKLLLALRWTQKRLARWQGWSWMLGSEEKQQQAQDGLKEDRFISCELRTLIETGKWPLVPDRLSADVELLKAMLVEQLVAISNRVVPLRGRNWKWEKRQDEAGYVLCQTERGSDSTKTRIAGQRGLSIERIELIEDLRKRCQSLNKALQHVPGTKPAMGFRSKGTEAADPCPDILEKLDQLREQRVNQTAHLILAEALGVQLKPHSKTKDERSSKNIHGEYEKVRDPVDFIVLEDLNRYLTSQGRSKAENSRLMKWCHRAILMKLKQLCETYGIPVLEVAAAYSSRFSAKDGVAGFRAKELTWADREKHPWKKMLENQEPDAVRLFQMLKDIGTDQNYKKPRKLLAPIAGGPIFIPMVGSETQADINAAINLGLRAVAAPEVLEIHHRIRTEPDGHGSLKPLTRSKRETARWNKNPESFQFEEAPKLERSSNCFPLIGFRADFENCTLAGQWFATGKGLWGTIKQRQWERIQALNEQRIKKNKWVEIDDIPYDF